MINIGESTKAWAEIQKIPFLYEETTKSTNELAKKNGTKDQNQYLYLANHQSEGRGRHKNKWENCEAPGGQLLSTWCYKLNSPPQHIAAPLFGWAVYKALNDEFDLALSIKAPNDIFSGKNKIAGLLIESVSQGENHYISVGLGINVNHHPKNLPHVSNLKDDIGFEIQENRWHSFLSNLNSSLAEAVNDCTQEELSFYFKNELTEAVKKWPGNNIAKILSNGDILLTSTERISWSEL